YVYAGDDPVNNQDPAGKEAAQKGICAAFARFLPGCTCGGTCSYPLPGGSPPPWLPPPRDPPRRLGICSDDNGDGDDEEACGAKLVNCLEHPQQPSWNIRQFGPRKDCGACFRFCKNE